MQPISYVIKESVPNYLASLPIPNTLGGWFRLGVRDWISLLPFGAAVAGFSFIVYRAFVPRSDDQGWVNPDIKKDSKKVVDVIDVEDISEKAAFCRCWRSKKFPYCDGAHGSYNKATGDNVGPICVQRKAK